VRRKRKDRFKKNRSARLERKRRVGSSKKRGEKKIPSKSGENARYPGEGKSQRLKGVKGKGTGICWTTYRLRKGDGRTKQKKITSSSSVSVGTGFPFAKLGDS